jgi:diaminopimelate dehydrogenase
MGKAIRIGIVGYGNLGRGVELALEQNPDLALAGIFTRREPGTIAPRRPGTPVRRIDELDGVRDTVDVLVLCGGSRDDLPVQTPALAARFDVVDSFDTHARIPEHFAAVDAAARAGGHVAVIAAGWDPGLFSLGRLYGNAFLPAGATYTFWGPGLSQGHSDAIRRVPGVKLGVQYTLPREEAVARVRAGERPEFTARDMHARACYVVLEDGADPVAVERAIRTMPHYFADYDTTVTFVGEEEFRRDHAKMPHGGSVLRTGDTGAGNRQVFELRLALDSNPEFTAHVLVAYARACHRLRLRGETGARTVFDLAPALLSPRSGDDLRRELL